MSVKLRKYKDIFYGKRRRLMIEELTRKYGFRCWYCGVRFKNTEEIHIDHIKALSDGGTSDVENLALSCKYCNGHKFYYSAEEFLGYLANIRTGKFECPILEQYEDKLDLGIVDILKKSFYP